MKRLALTTLAFVVAATGTARAGTPPSELPPFDPDPSTVVLSPVRDPDPDGGAPWGVRTFKLKSGWVCTQTGRVQDDKLGRVDENGVFTELPLGPGGCGGAPPPDAYQMGGWGGNFYPTNITGTCRGADWPEEGSPICTDHQFRNVFYGQFGTRAKRVTYADPDGSNQREVQLGPLGEYVVATKATWTLTNPPRIDVYFDGACDGQPQPIPGTDPPGTHIENCQWVVPVMGPYPIDESAASRTARSNPGKSKPNIRVTRRVGKRGSRISVLFKVPITLRANEGYEWKITKAPAACRKKLANQPGAFTTDYWNMVQGKTASLFLPLGGKSDRWCRGKYTVRVAFGTRDKQRLLPGSASFRIE